MQLPGAEAASLPPIFIVHRQQRRKVQLTSSPARFSYGTRAVQREAFRKISPTTTTANCLSFFALFQVRTYVPAARTRRNLWVAATDHGGQPLLANEPICFSNLLPAVVVHHGKEQVLVPQVRGIWHRGDSGGWKIPRDFRRERREREPLNAWRERHHHQRSPTATRDNFRPNYPSIFCLRPPRHHQNSM